MRYALDGSNIILDLKLNGKPSLRLFAKLLATLETRGDRFKIFFDHSLERRMAEFGLTAAWKDLLGALKEQGRQIESASRADTPIQRYCSTHKDAVVLNGSDRIDSWPLPRPPVHHARVQRSGADLVVAVVEHGSQALVFCSAPAQQPFRFRTVDYPALTETDGYRVPTIAPESGLPVTRHHEGNLLILALDASRSMTETTTFDGRAKFEHLNEIVKQSVAALCQSHIADGLYMAILRFTDSVTLFPNPITGTEFAHIFDWQKCMAEFDYLSGVIPRTTNIRLALERCGALLIETMSDTETTDALADFFIPTVVLITDGQHFVPRADGSPESPQEVASAAAALLTSVAAHTSGRLTLGCVGIGTDVNNDLLKNISSRATPRQQSMARAANLQHLFPSNHLFLTVSTSDPSFGRAVRTFIDMASDSTQRAR